MSSVVPAPEGDRRESRVLILAPTANDAGLTASFLAKSGLDVEICRDISDLCQKVEQGCGSLLLAEETLGGRAVDRLVDTLAHQPAWSDLPITVITSGGEVSQVRLRRLGVFGPGGNVTLLERPFRPATLISTVEVALRARRRQYEVRELLHKLQAGEQRLMSILDSISDAFIAIDRDWRITYVNPSYVKLVSPLFDSADELLGQNLWEKFPDIVGTEIGDFYMRTMAEQQSAAREIFYEPLNAWLDIRAFTSTAGLSLYVQDITARKNAETDRAKLYEEVRKSADHLSLAMAAAKLGDWSWDAESDLMTLSDRAAGMFGIAAGSHMTRTEMRNLIQGEDRERARVAAEEAPGAGGAYEIEYLVERPDGQQRWIAARGQGIFNAQGKMTGMLGVVQDMTARKRQEEALADLTRRISDQARIFDTALSNITDFAYTLDTKGRFIYVNKPLLDLWGLALEEATGKNFFELGYAPELAAKLQKQIQQVVETRESITDETSYTNPLGVEGWYEYIFSPVLAENGTVEVVAGSTRVITERRKAEEGARQLASIVQSSDDAIISKNLDGVIMSWNRGAERLFGFTADEAIGQSVTILIPPEHHDEEPAILERIRKAEQIQHYETIRRRKNGELIAVSLSVSPIKDHTGKVVGASKIARNITAQKRAERALKEAKEAAEAANRSKDHFLAVLSHELRTPLTPVLMTASALEMSPTVPANLRADMAMIRRNVELETKLIDDLLDLSRITTGKLALHVSVVAINEAVRQVCTICEQEIADKGVRLELDLDQRAGSVRADPARLQQVLWNVLKNAAKFTPKDGGIMVRTLAESNGRVQITIQDTGIGIDPKVAAKIFDAFEQGDAKITRQFGGLGLGLAITKALVELHEGKIAVQSDGLGRGSTFSIDLPASTSDCADDKAAAVEARADGSLRILIVEDHKDTAAMLGKLLGAVGYAVTVANTATAALELAERQHFDVVVSDIGLPDLTGYEFMKQLRERREITGIAMSGYGMEEDVRKSLEAGFSEHLVKPINLSSLEQAIRRLAQRRSAPASEGRSTISRTDSGGSAL